MIRYYLTQARLAFAASLSSPTDSPPSLIDIREEARLLERQRPEVRAKLGGARRWRKITGICLHQTACVLGERPGRWASLGAHLGITASGKILHVHDFNRVVYHAQAWNSGTIGIEIDGAFEGILGDESTLWKPPSDPHRLPSTLTDAAVESTLAAIRWAVAEVEAHGGRVRALVAHRQAKMTRRHDPGSEIWQRIALPISSELNLSDGGHGFSIGGRPIPEEWDPNRSGIDY